MGFWSNLFGTGKGPAYFLDDDDAKTYGDIDYMRKEITVERTYPEGFAEDVPTSKYVPPAMDNMGTPKEKDNYYTPKQASYTPPTSNYSAPVNNYTPSAPIPPSYTPPAPVAPATPELPTTQTPVAQTPEPIALTPPAPQSSASADMDVFRSMAKGMGR